MNQPVEVVSMKTARCLGLATSLLLLTGIPTTAADQARGEKPKRDYQLLVEPAQLQTKLDNPNVRILDARSSEEYSKGHIPGAVRVDVGDWKTLATADRGLHDSKGWAAKLGALGITPKHHVVVYGGGLSDAARIWWLLKYVGVENASLMNGSWESWAKSNLPSETAAPTIAETEFKPSFQADRIEDIDSLKKSLKSEGLKIVDTRSDREFAGGRIPGSTHLEWTELVAEDGRFKTRKQLRQLFRDRGIMPDDAAVCY
jgi:thiosulfate/3-mercaptopyruvate sulfurtransferase